MGLLRLGMHLGESPSCLVLRTFRTYVNLYLISQPIGVPMRGRLGNRTAERQTMSQCIYILNRAHCKDRPRFLEDLSRYFRASDGLSAQPTCG